MFDTEFSNGFYLASAPVTDVFSESLDQPKLTSLLNLAEAVPKGIPSCSRLRRLIDVPHLTLDGFNQAGEVGFEPTGVLPPLVFKTSAFVRSAIPPCGDYTTSGRRMAGGG
jgi:hypothetical protein